MVKTCDSCGKDFEAEEEWKTECLDCYIENQEEVIVIGNVTEQTDKAIRVQRFSTHLLSGGQWMPKSCAEFIGDVGNGMKKISLKKSIWDEDFIKIRNGLEMIDYYEELGISPPRDLMFSDSVGHRMRIETKIVKGTVRAAMENLERRIGERFGVDSLNARHQGGGRVKVKLTNTLLNLGDHTFINACEDVIEGVFGRYYHDVPRKRIKDKGLAVITAADPFPNDWEIREFDG